MATKSKKKAPKKSSSKLWGFSLESLLLQHLQGERKVGQKFARVHVTAIKKSEAISRTVEGADGIEIFLAPLSGSENENDSRLKTNPLVRMRDAVGATLGQLERMDVMWAEYDFNLEPPALEAAILGLEIALYRFKRSYKGEVSNLGLSIRNKGKVVSEKTIGQSVAGGVAVNLARHLVNLPPNILNPVTYADAVKNIFAGRKGVSVEVWDEKRLAKENMGLHLAVGQGSDTPPRLVHIRYRPAAKARKAPIAFVGKGITFDSGGLDIKPAAGMRLMKKDMGGSAALVGLGLWATLTGYSAPLDIYLALAENSINGNSFRPSDILTSRNGQSVEIHNTDAEGRLVLADALDVAATQSEKPRYLIDVATLTGAIKVALGSHIAGLFSNDARLSQALATSGQQAGDLVWAMPLFKRYAAQLTSSFADMVNATDGFGGAVTAALFLEKFVHDLPWAHLDIYAWKDSSEGAFLDAGGSGQSVLGLAQWLKTVAR